MSTASPIPPLPADAASPPAPSASPIATTAAVAPLDASATGGVPAHSPATSPSSFTDPSKPKAAFRDYAATKRHEKVRAFYLEQHTKMTYDFVVAQEAKYLNFMEKPKFEMGVWEALEYLDTFVDDSDPDTDLSQVQHALQTAEAIRAAYPDNEWFQLAGLIHDLGKILSIACGEPQWCTVGDTFPVGCAFAEECVYSEFFAENPDTKHPIYSTKYGVYEPNCGLDKVKMSWSHDGYLYEVCVRNGCTLPAEALAMIRYHSLYPWHNKGAYRHLTNEHDEKLLEWVLKFNSHDLYSKSSAVQDVEKLKPYYQSLIAKYFPAKLKW